MVERLTIVRKPYLCARLRNRSNFFHKNQIRKNMIKKIAITLCLAAFFSTFSIAQRIAIVDVTQILESLESYKTAQNQLDKSAAEWRQQIAQEYDAIKGLYSRYQAEQVLLSDDQRKQREDEIMSKERAVREMQKQKFGPEGELFEKRQDLIQPIQEKIYNAIEEFADDRNFDFIFDKGGSAGLLFANPQFDKTEDIMKIVK